MFTGKKESCRVSALLPLVRPLVPTTSGRNFGLVLTGRGLDENSYEAVILPLRTPPAVSGVLRASLWRQ